MPSVVPVSARHVLLTWPLVTTTPGSISARPQPWLVIRTLRFLWERCMNCRLAFHLLPAPTRKTSYYRSHTPMNRNPKKEKHQNFWPECRTRITKMNGDDDTGHQFCDRKEF